MILRDFSIKSFVYLTFDGLMIARTPAMRRSERQTGGEAEIGVDGTRPDTSVVMKRAYPWTVGRTRTLSWSCSLYGSTWTRLESLDRHRCHR